MVHSSAYQVWHLLLDFTDLSVFLHYPLDFWGLESDNLLLFIRSTLIARLLLGYL